MAKKQTRRSISVSRTTYERLKSFCETNSISMSQFVETRVGDFLSVDQGGTAPTQPSTPAPRPVTLSVPAKPAVAAGPARAPAAPVAAAPRPAVPMTSAAARFAVEPPPPIIKQKAETAAPKPVEKRPDQIFTF